jgi:hypothetical protein
MRIYIKPEYDGINDNTEAKKKDTVILSLAYSLGKIEHSCARRGKNGIEFRL